MYCCILRQHQEETIYLIFFKKIRNRPSFNVKPNQLGLEIPRMFLISLEHRILKNTPLYLWFAFSLQFCCLAVFSLVGKSIAISYILPRNIKHYTIWQCCHQVVSSRGNSFDIPQQNLKHGDTNNFLKYHILLMLYSLFTVFLSWYFHQLEKPLTYHIFLQ